MVVLIKTLQVILALSILIIIHEFGHFTFAKLFGIRVEKFYLFFDIGGKALLRFRKGETEFGIGWLPLGGYCKIAGMVDESLDVKSLAGEPQSWEFRSKGPGRRLAVMAGGVLFNFIFAIVAYSAISGIWGHTYINNSDSSVYVNDLAYEMGFRTGDRILDLDGYEPSEFGTLQADIVRRKVRRVNVERDGDTVGIYIDAAMTPQILNSPMMFDLAIPFTVDSVDANCANAGRGLVRGDRIVSINGIGATYLQDARILLGGLRDSTCTLGIRRPGLQGDILQTEVSVDSEGRIGVFVMTPALGHRSYNFWQSIPQGARLAASTAGDYVKDMGMLLRPSTGAYKSVGSFIAIGQIFPSAWDWRVFLNILALLSIMLGVVNLIPIPGLDGGHILFTLYEILTGRKPSDRFLTVAQMIGMGILIALMMLAMGNDIGRLIH